MFRSEIKRHRPFVVYNGQTEESKDCGRGCRQSSQNLLLMRYEQPITRAQFTAAGSLSHGAARTDSALRRIPGVARIV